MERPAQDAGDAEDQGQEKQEEEEEEEEVSLVPLSSPREKEVLMEVVPASGQGDGEDDVVMGGDEEENEVLGQQIRTTGEVFPDVEAEMLRDRRTSGPRKRKRCSATVEDEVIAAETEEEEEEEEEEKEEGDEDEVTAADADEIIAAGEEDGGRGRFPVGVPQGLGGRGQPVSR